MLAIVANFLPFVERSIVNPVKLLELIVQERLIWVDDNAAALRFAGAEGGPVGVGEGLGVGVGEGLGVPVGVGVVVGLGVGVAVGAGVGVGVAAEL